MPSEAFVGSSPPRSHDTLNLFAGLVEYTRFRHRSRLSELYGTTETKRYGLVLEQFEKVDADLQRLHQELVPLTLGECDPETIAPYQAEWQDIRERFDELLSEVETSSSARDVFECLKEHANMDFKYSIRKGGEAYNDKQLFPTLAVSTSKEAGTERWAKRLQEKLSKLGQDVRLFSGKLQTAYTSAGRAIESELEDILRNLRQLEGTLQEMSCTERTDNKPSSRKTDTAGHCWSVQSEGSHLVLSHTFPASSLTPIAA